MPSDTKGTGTIPARIALTQGLLGRRPLRLYGSRRTSSTDRVALAELRVTYYVWRKLWDRGHDRPATGSASNALRAMTHVVRCGEQALAARDQADATDVHAVVKPLPRRGN